MYQKKLIMRVVIGSRLCREEDIIYTWNEISSQAAEILRSVAPSVNMDTGELLKKSPNDIGAVIESLKPSNEYKLLSC